MTESSTPKLTAVELQAEYEYRCIIGAEAIAGIVFDHPDALYTPDTIDAVKRLKALADTIQGCGLPTDPTAYTLGFTNGVRDRLDDALRRQRRDADAGQRGLFDGGQG